MAATLTPIVFIPALLSDDAMYRELMKQLSDTIEAQVMVLSEPTMKANVEALLAKAPQRFVLAGTSYGGSSALEVGLAAPERVTALWLMGCNPAAPEANVQELVSGLEATPDAVIDMLATLAVPAEATEAAESFKAMAHRIGGRVGAAKEFKIHPSMLRNWRARGHGPMGPTAGAAGAGRIPPPASLEQAEIRRLQKELERAQMERDILKNDRGPAVRLWRQKQVLGWAPKGSGRSLFGGE